jgi:hypothetical protein
MPRIKGYGNGVASQREALENALAALIRVEYMHPITRLRVCQARDRGGMSALLEPALGELDDMHASVMAAKRQVISALDRLVS